MRLRDWLTTWGLSSLKINAGFLELEFKPNDEDRRAAWDMYVELLTRITTQTLPAEHGREEAALSSLYSLFPTTRMTLKMHGPACIQFSRIAVVVLNQVIRPVTEKWHNRLHDGGFASENDRLDFRQDLDEIRDTLVKYTKLLAEISGVEDLTAIEKDCST